MSGPRQHYLAAGVIGKFSTESDDRPTRDRKVWVLRRSGDLCRQAARSVAFENNLYFIGDLIQAARVGADGPPGPRDIEGYWSQPDGRINAALDEMLADGPGQYRADPWVHVASYISALFARSPEFAGQFRARFSDTSGAYVTRESTNMLRMLENQRVSAAVLRARWAILRSDRYPMIISDRGMNSMFNPKWAGNGYVLQLRPNIAMMLGQGPSKKLVTWTGDAWRIVLPTFHLDVQQARSLNEASWAACRREVYSGSEDELRRLRRIPSPPPPGQADIFGGARLLGLTNRQRMEDETLLMRLIGGFKLPPDPANPPILMV